MTLLQLKQDIINRWLAAYDESYTAIEAAKTVYAPDYRFELRDYNNRERRSLSTEKLPDYHFMYTLDQSDRPVYFEYQRDDKVYKKGYYIYTDTLTEYIEYDVVTAVPSCIQRLTHNSFQSIRINGKIDPALHGTTKEVIMDNLLKNELSLFCGFELYHYTDNRISSADCLYISPAEGEYTSQKKYNYDINGELDEILETDSDNNILYAYVKTPVDTSLQQLSDQVAEMIAKEIIATLKTVEMESPLGILQINFPGIGIFSPLLSLFSAEEQEDIEELEGAERAMELFSADQEQITVTGRSYERLLCAFMNEVNILENYDLATVLIRKTARILNNNKLNKEIPVTKKFMAYSIDMDTEPEGFSIVLKDCGLPEEEIEKWKDS